jgi:hypothetical protein
MMSYSTGLFDPVPDDPQLKLPDYTTYFLDHRHRLFSLYPFSPIDHQMTFGRFKQNEFTHQKVATVFYQLRYKEEIDRLNRESYNEDGTQLIIRNFKNNEVIKVHDQSLSHLEKTINDLSYVNAELGLCHFVVVKSVSRDCYWFLHYAPNELINNENFLPSGQRYARQSYSDLNPALPYELPEANLMVGEKVDVLVVMPVSDYNENDKRNLLLGYFDRNLFSSWIGKEQINSIKFVHMNSSILDEKYRQQSDQSGYDSDEALPRYKHEVLSVNFFPAQDRLIIFHMPYSLMGESVQSLDKAVQAGKAEVAFDRANLFQISPRPEIKNY